LNIKNINCNGRCGKRSTKQVPASQKFMEYVYKKYDFNTTHGDIPKKNKREYLCAFMKDNDDYCKFLNNEWSSQMASVPFVKETLDVENLQIVPFEPEDKVDYGVFDIIVKVDKKTQQEALRVIDRSKTNSESEDVDEYSFSPTKKMGYKAMRKYVKTYFSKFEYPKMEIVNKCVVRPSGNTDRNIIDYSPSQNFISHFFTPSSAYKGMLLWHSVGTGKTCSAIATTSATFEKEGYTILWVTRSTLKSDVYKNIFDMICHDRIATMVRNGETIPDNLGARTRMISDNWIKPISYKQFSNLLLGNNDYYKQLVERNGSEDVLRKTLVIIDEAHKLYGGDLKHGERPDTTVMERLIHNSYKKSGNDSVKLLIMTATPFTNSPMELFKLVNLMVDEKKEQLPTTIGKFKEEYMRDDGIISESGMTKLANQLAGYVSYLDRSKDASQFAQPVRIDVPVMMSHIENQELRNYIITGTKPPTSGKEETSQRKGMRSQIKTFKNQVKDENKSHRATMKKHKEDCKGKFPGRKDKKDRDACLEQLKDREMETHEITIRELTEQIEQLEKAIGDSMNTIEEEKRLKQALNDIKKSLLQEIQMATKCKLI